MQDDVLVGKKHATILSVNAPKEVRVPLSFLTLLITSSGLQIADVEGACQGLLGLEPY